tara:strand:- start:11961 stop:12965 length:1005 start_codon:yes stop_codon:yes gene_type:complete
MRIYTEAIMKWDDKLGKLVDVSSKSFEYDGEVALAVTRVESTYSGRKRGYAYQENLKAEYYDEEGNNYKIYERRWRRNKHGGQRQTRGYLIIATDKDGNFIRNKSRESSSKSKAKEGAKSYALQSGDVVYSPSEWKNKILADREARRLDLKAHEAVATAKQSAIDTTARQTEIAQKQTARVSGEAIRAQRDALLAQGYSPEEARIMSSQGTENVARTVADIGMKGQALHSQAMGDIAKFGAEQGWTAENLSMGMKQMQQDLMKHRESLANQLKITGMQTRAQKDAASKAMWGDIWGGVGEVVGGSTFNFGSPTGGQNRLGGEIRRLGGEIEGEE